MMHEEVKKYRELSGDTNPHTPISRIGGYLDGYEKALEQEPCKNTIDRQVVIDIVDSYSESKSNVEDVTQDIISDIVALPPVNPQAKTGHWIWCVGSHKCSNCEEYTCFSHKELLRYCPNCGAKMVEPQESEGKE